MGKLEIMKQEYDNTPIPQELNVRIQAEIEKSRKREEEKRRILRSRQTKRAIRAAEAAAAAACIAFTAALNTSQAFAKEAAGIPVIGRIAQVLTFRSYETEKDDIAISVQIPSVEMIAEDSGITAEKINQEIYNMCEQYADEAVLRAEEYRKAFLDTGGSPEEWAEHNVKITVDYEIKQQSDQYLSFVVRGTENWTNAYSESKYYNLSMATGEVVTLEDLLGNNYKEVVDESIRKQIAERQEEGEVFFTEEEGGFAGISEDVKFYINKNNHPVIVFDRYEIAPGSSGEPEFEIGGTEGGTYEDNFAVSGEAAKEFAEKIQKATADRNLEALAELTEFPVYVGLPDVGVVETKEDFLAIGAENIFTDELVASVEAADIENLQPSMAGFSLSHGERANINFGVADGVLAVRGINYGQSECN